MIEIRARHQSSSIKSIEEEIDEIREWLRSLAEMEDPVEQFEIWVNAQRV
jgi:hypothetical protein